MQKKGQKYVLILVVFLLCIFYKTTRLEASAIWCEYGEIVLAKETGSNSVTTTNDNDTLGSRERFITLNKVIINIELSGSNKGEAFLTVLRDTGEYVTIASPSISVRNVELFNKYNMDDNGPRYLLSKPVQMNTMYLATNYDELKEEASKFICPVIVVETGSSPELHYSEGDYSNKSFCGKNGKKCKIYRAVTTENDEYGFGVHTYDAVDYTDEEIRLIEESQEEYASSAESDWDKPAISNVTGLCTDYLGHASIDGTLANTLDKLFTILKVGAIVIFIIASMLNLSGVITSDKSELGPEFKKFGKRAVILLLILLLPTMIDMVFGLFGYTDVLCGIK